MLIVDTKTPGIKIIRNVGIMGEGANKEGGHACIRYNEVRVPLDAMLGGPGQGFKVAQARLGGGRVHHAMRKVGKCQRAIDMMLERAVSRTTRERKLGDHQFVQGKIADSIIELEQFRLVVLCTAWIIDNEPHGAARAPIAMRKVTMAKLMQDIVGRAVEIHGSLGMPLSNWWSGVMALAFADGPTDVHRGQIARTYLKKTAPVETLFPTEHIPTRLAAARARDPEAGE
jgi:acyl-CoA dehydrogenase